MALTYSLDENNFLISSTLFLFAPMSEYPTRDADFTWITLLPP